MRCGVFELCVGLLELRVMFAGARFEMAVVNEQNSRDGEQGYRPVWRW